MNQQELDESKLYVVVGTHFLKEGKTHSTLSDRYIIGGTYPKIFKTYSGAERAMLADANMNCLGFTLNYDIVTIEELKRKFKLKEFPIYRMGKNRLTCPKSLTPSYIDWFKQKWNIE